MAKRGKKSAKAEKAGVVAAVEAPATSMMPAACPSCAGPVSAVRETETKKVGGVTVQAPGEALGFVCTSESCPAFGTQQLFKATEEEEAAPVEAKEEDLGDLPKILQQAIVAFGLKRDDVLDYKTTTKKAGFKGEKDVESVTLVTRGGQKLRFPGDEARALKLTDSEKDGLQRTATPRFFPGGLSPQRGAIRG